MKRFLLLLLAGSLLLPACRRDGGPSWDTGLVLPIAHGSLTIDNLVPDSLTATNADGSIKLVYSTTFLGLNTDTIFNIPDTTIPNEYHLPFGWTNFNGGDPITPTAPPEQITYDLGTIELVNGILEEGQLILQLRNDIRRKIVLNYQVPCATYNAVSFDTSFVIPAAPDSLNGYSMSVVVDLSGYTIDFTGVNNDRVNTLTTLFSAQIAPGEPSVSVYPADSVVANTTLTGIKPYYIRGYFGNETVQVGPEETGFSFFKKITSGSIGLDSLKMSLSIDNYVGMDSRLTVNNIWSRNSRTGQTVYLSNSLMGTPVNVNRAQYSNTWPPSVPSSYNFVFDNGNSNAKALVENLPDYLGYDVTLVTNPLGNVSGNNDFLFADYGIDAKLNVEMPLNFFAAQLTVVDTLVPNFASVERQENVLDGQLTLFAQNSFPFDADIQVYFVDAFGFITDSVVAFPNRIASGPINSTGLYYMSSGFTSSQVNIPLNTLQTRNLFSASRIIIKATFDTNSSPSYVKIFSSNRLDFQLTADFNYRFGN